MDFDSFVKLSLKHLDPAMPEGAAVAPELEQVSRGPSTASAKEAVPGGAACFLYKLKTAEICPMIPSVASTTKCQNEFCPRLEKLP